MKRVSIGEYLRALGYNPPPDEIYGHIDEWMDWYQGDVEKFHTYNVWNGIKLVECRRKRLGMAKKICEDWANLILNEKVGIKAGDYNDRLSEILERNNFRVRGNQLVEVAYALGTGAFVEYLSGDEVIVDYIRADMIHPLSWDNGDIVECAFGSYRNYAGEAGIYVQIHRRGKDEFGENPDIYYIENRYVNAETGEEIDPPAGVIPIVATGSERPLYQIITPNIQNNIDLDSPLGISIYANCIDQLKGCDIIYDSYINEFTLGKKRIIVPASAARIQMNENGMATPLFDPEDTVYYAMPGDRNSDLQLTENNMTIRSQDHELGIQRALDLLSLKCGMGTGRYQFNSSGVKTATEVTSDKSDLYQNLKKNEIPVTSAILGMVDAIAFLDGYGPVDATVDFDDSIIEDSNATIDKNIKLVQSGLRSKLSAIMEIQKCDEAEAQKELERIAEEGQITGQDIDWTQDDGEYLEKEKTIGFQPPQKEEQDDEE